MSRGKEFSEPIITSVRAERKDLDLAKALGIRCSVALRNGIRNLAEGYLEGLKEVPEDLQNLIIDLKKRDADDTERRFRSDKQNRKTVAAFIKLHNSIESEEELKGKKIRVYDRGFGEIKIISLEQFHNDPECYEPRPVMEDDL